MRNTLPGVFSAILLSYVASSASAGQPNFGAPLRRGLVFVEKSAQQDAYGQSVDVALYRTDADYRRVSRFYRRKLSRKRSVRVTENRESVKPGYIADPADPSSSVPVLRVLNLDYTGTWAAVFVRPLPSGTLVAVLQRKPPPEVSGTDVFPARLEIPIAVFQTDRLPALTRD